MATKIADPFYADPPFCIKKVDVSSFEYIAPMPLHWISYLYFNTYKLKAGATATDKPEFSQTSYSSTPQRTESTGAVADSQDVLFEELPDPINPEEKIPHEPINRLCGTGSVTNYDDDDENGFYATELSISNNWGVIEMYDGDYEDGATLLGYGIDSTEGPVYLAHAFAGSEGGAGYVGKREALFSCVPYSLEDQSAEASGWWRAFTILYERQQLVEGVTLTYDEDTVRGFPFIKVKYDISQPSDEVVFQAEIGDLEFFYYPKKAYPA